MTCYLCGGSLEQGSVTILHGYGTDPETGYMDNIEMCVACAESVQPEEVLERLEQESSWLKFPNR